MVLLLQDPRDNQELKRSKTVFEVIEFSPVIRISSYLLTKPIKLISNLMERKIMKLNSTNLSVILLLSSLGFGCASPATKISADITDRAVDVRTVDVSPKRAPASDISTKVISIIVDRNQQVGFKVNEAGYAYREKLTATTKTQGDFNLSHRFSLEIDGVAVQGVRSAEGFESKSDSTEYQGGKIVATETQPPNHTPGRLTITKDWSNTDEFSRWRKSVLDGKTDRKSISIIFHNDAGDETGRINLTGCYPTKWTGPALNAKSSGMREKRLKSFGRQLN